MPLCAPRWLLRLACSLLLLLLPACSSLVGWGRPYEILHRNPKSITVKYDPLLADVATFAPALDAHCQQYGREAVFDAVQEGGLVRTLTFRCE